MLSPKWLWGVCPPLSPVISLGLRNPRKKERKRQGGQGVLDAVLTPPYVSPTPAPPASIPTHLVPAGTDPDSSASGFGELPTSGPPESTDTAPLEIVNDRPWPPHQDTRDLDGAIPQQRLSSTYSPLPPSTSCGQDSPEPLARPLVAPPDLTQVTDLRVGLVRGCGLDHSISSRNVAHSAYHTFFRREGVCGTTS